MKVNYSFKIFILFFSLSLHSCIINNPKPEDCQVIEAKITKIKEGSSYDIVFYSTTKYFYYINRGLERGLNLDTLNKKLLNKTVTLHLAKVLGGRTTNHISQLTLANDTIFTEFKTLNNK